MVLGEKNIKVGGIGDLYRIIKCRLDFLVVAMGDRDPSHDRFPRK